MKKPKYGIVLLTDNADILDKFDVEDGLYVAVKFSSIKQDSDYFDWIGRWLKAARPALIKKLKEV